MTFKQLRESSGMSRPEFAAYFGIPYRTIQDWELENRKCPVYLMELIKYKLETENKKKKLLALHENVLKNYKSAEIALIEEYSNTEAADLADLETKCNAHLKEFHSVLDA